jgi:hypothetical protein
MSLWRKRQIQNRIDAITSADPFNTPAKKIGTQTVVDNVSGVNNYYIRGEMVALTKHVNSLQMIQGDPHFAINLKLEMAQELGAELLKHGCIEFTSQDDPVTLAKLIRARCFVVPSEDVQILREKGF